METFESVHAISQVFHEDDRRVAGRRRQPKSGDHGNASPAVAQVSVSGEIVAGSSVVATALT